MAKKAVTEKEEETERREVNLVRVSEELLDQYVERYELDVGGSGVASKLDAVVAHQLENTPENQIADCDNCGGESDVRLDACPYCGVGGLSDSSGKVVKPASEPARPKKAEKSPAQEVVTNVVPIKDKKQAKPEPQQQKLAKVERPEKAEVIGRGEVQLNNALERVEKARKGGLGAQWDYGREIFKIYEGKLWTQRLGEDGSPRYKHWSQFCQAELGLAASYAYKVMDVCNTYTKEDYQQIGFSKLSFILRVSPELQSEMLDKARSGLPLSQVTEEVRKLAGGGRRDTGRGGFGGGKKGAAKGTAKLTKPKAKKGQLTAVLVEGRAKIPLFKRPPPKTDPKRKPERALKVEHDGFGVWQLENGVEIHFRLVRDSQGLALAVECRRAE